MSITQQVIKWLNYDTSQVRLSAGGFVAEDANLFCFNAGVPVRRNKEELMELRYEYLNKGLDFPLDNIALIALNRIVKRPLRFAQVEDQLGGVVAVSYSYPQTTDPLIPVPLVKLGKQFDNLMYQLCKHLDGYNYFHNQKRWGSKARNLSEKIETELQYATDYLTKRELAFICYHVELSIAQPWRSR